MKKFFVSVLTLLSVAASAQDLHESFTVLGEYIPDIIRQDKIHTLPEKILFTMPASSLPYATKGIEGNFRPSVGVVDPPLWRARLQKAPRGYLDFGMGNYLNMVGSAGYRIVDDSSTQAGLWLQHNSWWGFHPQTTVEDGDYTKKYVEDRVGVYLRHTFTAGTLGAAMQYHGAWFNYYGSGMHSSDKKPMTQTIVNPSLAVEWKGAETGPWAYAATINYHYFSFRHLWSADGTRENAITLDGSAAYRMDERNSLALTLNAGTYLYNDPFANSFIAADPFQPAEGLRKPSTDYGLVSIVPQYRFTDGNLHLTAGAELTAAINAGRSVDSPFDRHRQAFYAAPHVDISYTRGIAALALQAKGGVKANTMQAAADADLYTMPVLAETTPQYSPLDARFILTLNPNRILTAAVRINYAILRGIYPTGDFMVRMDPSEYNSLKVRGFMAGADITLRPADWCRLSASLDYSPQHDETGYFNGYDRPRWILDATARFTPTDRITVALNYNYRGVRRFYFHPCRQTLQSERLRDLTYLNIQASWRIVKPLTVWLQVRNILGCRADILPGQQVPGCTFTAGFGLNF